MNVMKNAMIRILLLSLFVATAISCKKKSSPAPPPPPVDTLYTLTPDTLYYPPHFPVPIIPADNQPSKELISLGRMLYYDIILSNDGRACAGCHVQANGFTSRSLYQNLMPVLPHENLAWSTNFMWDGSKKGTLEDVMLFEVQTFFGTDLQKINKSSYRSLFRKYFRVDSITHKEIAYSLAQFLRSVITKDSKYDRIQQGRASFTADEYMGYNIFFTEKGDCFPVFSVATP